MIRLTENDWQIFRRLQRKHKVSTEFLRYNLQNIEKFIWYQTWPRIIIKRYAIRKHNRVFIIYYRLRRVLFDQCNRKLFKRMRQNIKQWSKRMVTYLKTHIGIKEYVEEVVYENRKYKTRETETDEEETVKSLRSSDDVSKQLKEQLELLRSSRRLPPLISSNQSKNITSETTEAIQKDSEINSNSIKNLEKQSTDNIANTRQNLQKQLNNLKAKSDLCEILNTTRSDIPNDKDETQWEWQINLESTPEKQITTQENVQPMKLLASDEKTEKSNTEDDHNLSSSQQTDKFKTGLNFLDMLMSKVTASSTSNNLTNNNNNKSAEKQKEEGLSKMSSLTSLRESFEYQQEHSMDSTDGFLGFDDCERIPGMLMTPIVPHSTKNNKNSVFVSESLNEYMRLNDLETDYSIDKDKSVIKSKIFARDMEGLMTPKTVPPPFDMPAVPENLLKFRTVAERKQYLQKFSKNYRLAIINNEASIYRELQRRMRTQKVKSASQQLAQSSNSSMSFTRNGWKAASFINTEFNKYYYQVLEIDNLYKVRLRGARGNNDEFRKTPYTSRVVKVPNECPYHCVDERVWQDLKPIKTIVAKTKKLNKNPLPSVFKPCPLSHKTFQKPLDDDTAALLLAGGSMAVVRMPTVELEVFPEFGRPLHEIAKRYLQYILPHHDISREWAEFSVSTLQQPKSLKEAEQAAAKSFNTQEIRKSYTFVIPYLNDRNHILVRRVVDRSEKLDHSFENCPEEKELVPKNDFSFRQNLNENDRELLICADVVSDMINTVAISCSENSFIKNDPDATNTDDEESNVSIKQIKLDENALERPLSSSPNTTTALGYAKKQKKQNSLLLELKRLNATIIDAATKTDNDKKPCSKAYCQMGCVCASLAEDLPMREHCGKSKCMLECTCKSSSQSRIMRLETDGRTITTEDAFMLRRKATARLARMEKEFTSTVVLTENETLLINETNNDKKRRCTKAPKRYEDFTDTEDEQRKNSPKKTALTTIDNEKHLQVEIKELREPVFVKDSILEQLKHCTVNLVPLQDMENIAPWCMIHNLYKCYCKGRAIEGKPVVIEKEELNTTVEHEGSEQKLEAEYPVSVKPKYTFEKVEKIKKSTVHQDDDDDTDDDDDDDKEEEDYEQQRTEEDDDQDDEWIQERKHKKKEQREKTIEKVVEEYISDNNSNQSKTDDESVKSVKNDCHTKSVVTNLIEKNNSKPSLHEVRLRFFQARDECCRRQIPIPRRMFLYCNRKRRLNVLKFIKENENEQTRLLLNEHVIRSVYYHKIDSDSQKKLVDMSSTKEKQDDNVKIKSVAIQKALAPELLSKTENTKTNSLPVNEIVDLLEDDEEPQVSNQDNNCDSISLLNDKDESTQLSISLLNDKDESTQLTTSSTKSCTSFDNLVSERASSDSNNQSQVCSSNKVITVKQFATLSTLNTDQNEQQQAAKSQNEKSETSSETPNEEVKLPKIKNCFSLNAKANLQKSSSKSTFNEEQQQHLDFTSATSVHSAAFSQSQDHQRKHTTSPSAASTSTVKINDRSSTVLDLDNENVKDVYNSVIKTMNSLVSKKMQDIDCALQRESHIIPAPNADILCIMKWANFLDAFCEGFAYIWQVKIKDATFFVVTICNMMPLIPGAMGIVNITALKPDRMPLIGKMLLQKFRNKETEKLAIVMQGKQSHWIVKGFLRADPALACNKPTPESHPSLTKKINVLCSLLVKQRQREQKKKENLAAQWTSPQMTMATQTLAKTHKTQPSQATPKVAQIMPIRRLTTTVQQSSSTNVTPSSALTQQPTNPQLISPLLTQKLQQPINQLNIPELPPQTCSDTAPKPVKINIIEGGKNNSKNNNRKRKIDEIVSNNLLKANTYSKMSSNIEFRTVNQNDINEISLPELIKLDHKWLVLDLHNDFSHIFVPDFRDLVSLDRIQKVINFARQKNKIVKLQFFQNAPFDAFVTPKSGRKIYFGPLAMDMNAPTLILLQSVDGQMMLRELYQLKHNIVKNPEEKTKAFWLIHIKGQTHFEMDIGVNNEQLPVSSTITPIAWNNVTLITNAATSIPLENNKIIEKNKDNDDDDDEDCMIIDDGEQNVESKSQERYNFTIKTSLNDTTVSITPQPNSLPGPLPIQTLQTFKANNTDSTVTQSLLKVPNTNTIIKSVNPSITTSPGILNPPPTSATNSPLPMLSLPPNTVITGFNLTPATNIGTHLINLPANAIISAPEDASYTSSFFITSSSSAATTPAFDATTTTASTAAINNLTTISTLTESQPIAKEEKSDNNPQQMKRNQQTFDAAAIKRRRISLFCSNKYDKISENLAVDAVMKNILPNNNEYIQINPLPEEGERNSAMKTTKNFVTTIGSTKISKLSDVESKTLNTKVDTEAGKKRDNSKKPLVFDVNFMDDGDEPTASIVIKPTTSKSTSQTAPTTSSSPQTGNVHVTTTTTSTTITSVTNTKCTTNTMTSNIPLSKAIKLPTLFNTPGAVTGSNTNNSGKEKLLNALLYAKQQSNIVPKLSTPRLIRPKPPGFSANSTSTSVQTIENLITKPPPPSPSPLRKTSLPLKVQKVVGVTSSVGLQVTSPTSVGNTSAANQQTSNQSPTLTVKQVQAMLNKPGLNVASTVSSATTATTASTSMQLQIPSAIKTTIAPSKATATSVSTENVRALQNSTLPSSSAGTSNANSVSNSTLTISKVQSFGSPPQKPQNSPQIAEKNVQSFAPSQGQVKLNDVSERLPIPPSHIQYGYIVSASYASQKFVAKRVAEEFYVKVPSVGILKLQGLPAVNTYLNKHINKNLKDFPIAPVVWQFVAASKAVQMQNHQKSLLVRQAKPPIGSVGLARNKNANASKSSAIDNTLNEPILIDD